MSVDDLTIELTDTDGAIPMTAAQRGIYYAQLLEPEVPMSVAAFAEFHDAVDADLMCRAVAATSIETESGLITLVSPEGDVTAGEPGDGEPQVRVDHTRTIPLHRRDFSDADDPRAAALAWIDEHRSQPTDLFSDPLLETYLLELGPRHSIWYCWGHHLAFDGYAAMYMMLRVAAHYTALATGSDVPPAHTATMAQVAEFDRDWRESPNFDAALQYWDSRLHDESGAPAEITSLSTGSAPAAPVAVVRPAVLDADLIATIRAVAERHQVKVASVITAAVSAYLAKLNNRTEAMTSLPVACRDNDLLRTSAGLTSNVLPIRVELTADDAPRSIGDLIRATNGDVRAALRHQRFRHEDITGRVLDSPSGRRGFFGPMVNVMLFFEHIDFATLRGELNVLSTGPVEDASINVYDGFTGGMRLDLEANPNLYSPGEIEAHHRRIIDFLERFVRSDAGLPITSLPLPGIDEQARIDAASHGDPVDLGDATVLDLLDEAVRTHTGHTRSGGTAIVDATSCDELDLADFTARAQQLADALTARGIGPESVVGVALPRSVEQIVALHAVLRAGAAFLPIDPAEPAERLAHIVATAAPTAIIVDSDGPALPTAAATLTVSELSTASTDSGPTDSGTRPWRPLPDQPAYVLFTSGSTGMPKGVTITHRALVNRLRWTQVRYRLAPGDRVLQKTPATFDVSVWEFFWPFISGSALVVPTPDGHRDPWYLREVIDRHAITTVHFVPSMLAAFAETLAAEVDNATSTLRGLRRILTSGEALTPATVAATARITDAPIHNLYGPTEAAIDVTHHDHCGADETVTPIGTPVWNTDAIVLDHRLCPQPVGAIGELYLGGPQLARGYAARADLTASRFIATADGGRLYRTGDLVRRRTDGALEYLGRSDSQVKIRGQRVELGEIETVLAQLDGVSSAAVALRGDVVDGDVVLVGYLCGDRLDSRDLRSELAQRLPAHMVPTTLMLLEHMPTTANGKLDRRALPVPERAGSEAHVEPVGATEHLVADTVGEVLGRSSMSMSDNFFDAGGNSLSATRVAARLTRATGRRVGIRDIFDSADLRALATVVDDTALDTAPDSTRWRSPSGPVPLSPAQHRLWLTDRLGSAESANYHIPFSVRLVGELDVDALHSALVDVITRHEPLRSTVVEIDGTACIEVHDAADVDIDLTVTDTDKAVSDLEFAGAPFDLAHDIPLRARLVRAGSDDHRLTIVIHHIAADGWSLTPLADDLATAYRSRAAGRAPEWAPLRVSYSQFSATKHAAMESDSAADDLEFWRAALADAPAETELPLDRPRPREHDSRGATTSVCLPPHAHAALHTVAESRGASTFMALHALVAALLRTGSTHDDLVIGTPVAGRGDADLDHLVGMFVNTIPLRTRVHKHLGFDALLDAVRAADLDAFDHAELPFDRIVTELNPTRAAGHHPFFSVSVALAGAITGGHGGGRDSADAIDLDFADLSATASRIDVGHTKFDLQFTFTERHDADGTPAGMSVEIGYATALFDATTIASLSTRLRRILEAIVADPGRPIGDITLLDPAERLGLVPAVGMAGRPGEHLTDLLAEAVRAEPDRIAVRDTTTSLTYRELDRRANRLARELLDLGAGPERFVAVAMPRGVDTITAVWAITRTGAAWVPVDPTYPSERIAYMIDDSQAVLLLTDSGSAPMVNGVAGDRRVIVLDEAGGWSDHSDAPIADDERLAPLSVDHPAYLIYTSGTTGTPKGVVVSHRGLADFAAHQVAHFGLTARSRTLHLASPSFDASVLEMLMAISAAATMHIAPPGIVGGRELAELMNERAITHAFLTPSLLSTLSPDDVPDLHALVIGGEHPNPEAVREWSRGPALFNAYGPTETTVVATVSEDITPVDSTITIGRPIRGIAALVLDERLQPVAPGTVGELYIAGPHLARGYHGIRPLTSKRFIANPFGAPGDRMYRTGDLVRWTSEHELEFRGRTDDQTKIRGHRIELGEIDAVLTADDAVASAVTVTSGAGESASIVAFVTLDGDVDPASTLAGVSDRIRDHLPAHMLPRSIVALSAIPTTPIGKIDRRALADPDTVTALKVGEIGSDTGEYVAPANAAERMVAQVIAERLQLDPASVGRDHDFFELGGNSLLATHLAGALEQLGGRRIEVREVFAHPTVAGLARLAGEVREDDPTSVPASDPQSDDDGPVVPGPAQQQLWFLNRLGADDPDADTASYTIAFALDLRGDLDVDALREALRHAVDRHEPLRTIYPDVDGRPELRVLDTDDAAVDLTLEHTTAELWPQAARELARRPFDLTRDTPLRVALHRIDSPAGESDHHKLTVVVHHIAADGWSMAPLATDIAGAYARIRDGRSSSQPPLRVGYRDHLRWQARGLGVDPGAVVHPRRIDDRDSRLATLADWWEDTLSGMDHTPILAPDAAPTHNDSAGDRQDSTPDAAGVVRVDFGRDIRDRLRGLAGDHVTEFTLLHTLLAATLRHHDARPEVQIDGAVSDVVIGTPVSGRTDPRLADIVGMFVNSVVLRTPVDGQQSFGRLLDEVRDRDLDALVHADMPFEYLVARINPPRTGRHPLFSIALAADASMRDGATDLPLPHLTGLEVSAEEVETGSARFDLEIRLRSDTLVCTYATDVYSRARVESVARDLVALAHSVLDDPDRPLDDVLPSRTAQVRTPDHEAPPPRHLAEFLETAAAEHPNAVAVDDGTAALTYRELLTRAERWAAHLRDLGIGTDDVVAVALPRSLDSVTATWAVALTGGAVLPIDPRHPDERIAHMLTDSGALLGITSDTRLGTLPHLVWWVDTVSLDAWPLRSASPRTPEEELRAAALAESSADRHPDSAAYVIYTSGSTGTPKGVIVTHAGLAAFSSSQRDRYGVESGARTLHFASPSFDASMLELLLAVDAGATMVIAPTDIVGGDELVDFLAAQKITHAFITPAALATAGHRELPDLVTLAVGGEATTAEQVSLWAPGRRMINCYGPTETTIVATMSAPLQPGAEITIGTPVAGTTALVLDHRLRPVPDDCPGELYLISPGVARGYLHRSALTATRFIAAPDLPGVRAGTPMYRTGDVVHQRLDGSLIFHGRSDNQVKVRGFRIELDEVGAALAAHPAVDFAAAAVGGTGADAVLLGYVRLAVNDSDAPTPADLRAFVSRTLPSHMVPAAVIVIDEIPLTPNGKLDRKALLALERTAAAAADEPATAAPDTRSPLALVAETIAGVLDIDPAEVDADADFFGLGGTSLQATTVISRLNRHHGGTALRVRDLFDHPRIGDLAALVHPAAAQPVPVSEKVERPAVSRPVQVPPAPVQRGLWSIARANPASTDYLIPLAIRLDGSVDLDALRGALTDLVAKHVSLRTVFPALDSAPHGVVLEHSHAVIGDLAVQTVDELPAAIAERLAQPIDPVSQAPIRAHLLAQSPDPGNSDENGTHVLLLVIHHIAADGASLPILAADLAAAYAERLAGRTDAWAEPDVDYRDYAIRAAALEGDDLAYWTELHADSPTETAVPATRAATADEAGAGRAGTVAVPIDDALRSDLVAWARENATTGFTVLHTALAILLHRLGVGDDLVIGSPVANRSGPNDDGPALDCTGMVGMFVNTLALRTRVRPDDTIAEVLERVRDADLSALDRRDTPFDEVVEAVNPDRSPGRHPLFQIALSVHDFGDGLLGTAWPLSDELTGEILDIGAAAAKFDLQFTVTGLAARTVPSSSAPGAMLEVTFDRTRYGHADTEILATRLLRVVRAMITDADRPIGDVRITDPLEVAEVSPARGPESAPTLTLGTLFDEAVRRNPDGCAAVAENADGTEESLTYAELDARANRLARVILGRDLGDTEPVVAMAIPRSIDALVAIWAIVRSGAAYVPIDPTYPADRITHMLADSGAVLVLTRSDVAERIGDTVPTVVVDSTATRSRLGRSAPTPISDRERIPVHRTDALAYVIYTSGSTGRPKGVLVPHSGLRAVHDELHTRMAPGADSRVLHFASPSFDASVLEFLLAASGSAALVIVPPDLYGGTALAEFIDRHRVSHAFITPAAVASMDPASVPTLSHLAIGGEAYGPDLVRRWAPDRTVLNVYGPTETTIIVTGSEPLVAHADPNEIGALTIGTPNNGVAALVLDPRLHPVPTGVIGELYLLGDQVTRGYHRRPALTAQRYLPVPMVAGPDWAGARMYRTGDLVARDELGRLRYVGRSDNQVQLRGFRVELGEIDDALCDDPTVDFAVTVLVEDDAAEEGSAAPAGLHSYVRAADGATIDTAALTRQVANRLPRHMVPASITVLDEIPLTPVGKLDRAALPQPARVAEAGRAPRPGTETLVASTFADILGIAPSAVHADDGFFDLGGNSLSATEVSARLSSATGRDIRVNDLFAAPTPAELAAVLGDSASTTPAGVCSPESDDHAPSAMATVLPLRRRRTADGPAPLFVIHPAIGLSWSFSSLLAHLPADRPVYGLQHPALSGGVSPNTVGELAAHYVEQIRTIHPDGPYHLLGWSLGGLIAHEMAVQLTESGEKVGQLMVLDAFVVAQRPDLDTTPDLGALLAEFGIRPQHSGELTIERAWEAVVAAGGPLASLDVDEFAAVHRVFVDASRLAENWHPRRYDGDAVFVSATADTPPGPPAIAGWTRALRGHVHEIRLNCSHARMLQGENVPGFARAIAQA
ncbi:non-ribosomal peptide synthetase [Gordonia polyisoprenivorans]|uniref:non-ribosomal peptide synthetase n=1 Tax=Gordonia polyisoprenivorans TaxID=84595 RepID=UPI002301B35E|nr:non-ribosomal peptide synthetase [Gordonia polyisoprenivorans]WCB36107.1 amino acid adenylation domain-containing protein [Gordonia polyisoprenivorans]